MTSSSEQTVREMIAGALSDPALVHGTDEASVVERAMLRSCAVVERFVSVCATNDPCSITDSCLEGLVDLLGATGAAIEWRGLGEPKDRVFNHRGLSDTAADTLRASNFQFSAPDSGERRIRTLDLQRDAELDGTFLKSVLSQEGIGFVTQIPIAASVARGGGTAWIVHAPSHRPAVSQQCICAMFLERYASAIDRILLARRSSNWSSQFRSVLEGAMDGIVCLDREGRVVAINEPAIQMFGLSEEEVLYRPVHLIIPSFESQLQVAAAARARGVVIGSRLEVEGVGRGDRRFPMEISVSENPAANGFTLVMRDLTERKRIESQVWQADRLAAIGTLAAGLGHDMNNVLLPIRAHLNALADPTRRLDARRRIRHVDEIRGSVSYLQQLADALHFLAMDPQADGDDTEGTEVEDWWRCTGALLQKALGRRATLSVSFEPDLPRIAIQRHALTRAVLNLFVNAAEAMPPGRSVDSCAVVLRARRSRDRDAVVLEVEDNGEGMTAEVRRRALDVFYTTKPRGLGTGLGLPLVRGVVERCGGQLDIESKPAVGTTVRLIVPVSACEGGENGGSRAVLTIHDGRLAAMVTGILAGHGFTVDAEGGPEDADCWILDARECVAAEARRWLRTHAPNALVLIGRASEATAREMSAIGATLVEDERDFEAIRRGILRAVGIQETEGAGHV
jgi:PAS domain S-box-containing protein